MVASLTDPSPEMAALMAVIEHNPLRSFGAYLAHSGARASSKTFSVADVAWLSIGPLGLYLDVVLVSLFWLFRTICFGVMAPASFVLRLGIDLATPLFIGVFPRLDFILVRVAPCFPLGSNFDAIGMITRSACFKVFVWHQCSGGEVA